MPTSASVSVHNRAMIFLAASLGLLFVHFGEQCRAEEGSEWQEIKGSGFVLYYKPGANLKKVERSIRHRYFLSPLRSRYSDPSYEVTSRISLRLEAIFMRVQELLSMYPAAMNIQVRMYRDREELGATHERILKFSGRHRSFYVHKLRTIFTSEQDISDSVIAHEIAHAVLDHYFNTVPPAKVAELLATYVDAHLED